MVKVKVKREKCGCGCGRYAKIGNRFIHGHHRKLPPGHRAVTHSNKPAKEYFSFAEVAGPQIGSIFPLRPDMKYYDLFSSQKDAIDWWAKNCKELMKKEAQEFFADVEKHKGEVDPWKFIRTTMRPNIFWELSLGVSYPEDAKTIFLLEAHSLWWPGERELVLKSGVKIPKVKFTSCLVHPCFYPIKWPSEPAVKFEDGKLLVCYCDATMMVRDGKI